RSPCDSSRSSTGRSRTGPNGPRARSTASKPVTNRRPWSPTRSSPTSRQVRPGTPDSGFRAPSRRQAGHNRAGAGCPHELPTAADTMTIHPKPRFEPTPIAPETFLVHNHHGEGEGPVSVALNSMVIRAAEPVVVDTGVAENREQFLADVFSLVEPADVRWVF